MVTSGNYWRRKNNSGWVSGYRQQRRLRQTTRTNQDDGDIISCLWNKIAVNMRTREISLCIPKEEFASGCERKRGYCRLFQTRVKSFIFFKFLWINIRSHARCNLVHFVTFKTPKPIAVRQIGHLTFSSNGLGHRWQLMINGNWIVSRRPLKEKKNSRKSFHFVK